ncbi:unnamed protein product [Bursaphelenchus xylophilus]|uniref:(pine wood nematode) hypothetical protein n=1 Tax=Bursaphelenchus xylophilus TaxID=6326 RepID=A0A1I7SX89_BURXY|nr:unnamed protein product [Bursaphelenchus xylophilus]CAG9100256.1 unnamed protein product [Bursaphelenchus xylophilus]
MLSNAILFFMIPLQLPAVYGQSKQEACAQIYDEIKDFYGDGIPPEVSRALLEKFIDYYQDPHKFPDVIRSCRIGFMNCLLKQEQSDTFIPRTPSCCRC